MKQLLRQWGPRAVGLLVTAVGLYVVAPSVVALLGQWPQLRDVKAEWFVILFVLEVSSWACLWVLVHMLLPSTPWPAVGSAQLAGLASGCVLPGGAATGSVIQASVLVRAGNGAGQQRLTGAWRAAEQHAARNATAETAVLLWVAQKVRNLGQLLLRLIDAGHVGERDRARIAREPSSL